MAPIQHTVQLRLLQYYYATSGTVLLTLTAARSRGGAAGGPGGRRRGGSSGAGTTTAVRTTALSAVWCSWCGAYAPASHDTSQRGGRSGWCVRGGCARPSGRTVLVVATTHPTRAATHSCLRAGALLLVLAATTADFGGRSGCAACVVVAAALRRRSECSSCHRAYFPHTPHGVHS